jgi:FkbM family methyltransferase
MGIMKYQNMQMTGEDFFVRCVLPRLIAGPNPVLVDVGANVGDFSRLLREQFPSARIYAFEPLAPTFARLRERTAGLNIRCVNAGLGSKEGPSTIYLSSREELNVMASMYSDVAQSIHRYKDIVTASVHIRTLDAVGAEENLEFIDLLKADTEGHEFEVLQGARNLIQSGRVGAVLFEFNEMNTISRVFLRDFYGLLSGYRFYRLDTHRLIPLGDYQPRYEIFQFQNILAVSSVLHPSKDYTEAPPARPDCRHHPKIR